jgi:hypothetical protein
VRYAVFLTDSKNLTRNKPWIRDYGVGPFKILAETENCYLLEMLRFKWGWEQKNYLIKDRFSVMTGAMASTSSNTPLVELEDML